MESELPAGGLGEGCHPTLAISGDAHDVSVAVRLAHQEGNKRPEAPDGAILVVLLLLLDADAEDLPRNK